jgi:glucose/arabinose dehydrogenase
MLRALILTATSLSLLALPPLGGHPAGAAVSRLQAIDCRAANDECWPAAFAFTPSGNNVFYVERYTGQIRKHTLASNKDRQWARIDNVAGSGEQGVLGITLDPRWSQAPKFRWVYVYYTHQSPLQNRIIRLRKLSGGGMKKDILQKLPAASGYHNGGVIHIGPDKKLYAVTGEAHDPARAQDKDDPAGKVLRLNLNGTRPGDNPIAGSKAFSFGHRNSFGFTFDPETDVLWQTENGPGCEDEVNRVLPGRNYGWGGNSKCPGTSTSGPNPVQPEWDTGNTTIAPTGAVFCDGCGLGSAPEGDLLFGAWNDGKIRRLVLNAARTDVTADFVLFDNPSGVMAVEGAPSGKIFFSDRFGIYRLKQT